MLQFSPVILINFSSERWGWRCRQRNLANLSPECIRCTTPSRFSFSALQFLSFSSLLGLSPKTCFRPTCWTLLVCVRQSAWEILKNRGNETAWAGREVEASWVVADSCRLWLKQFLKSDLTSFANSSQITSYEPREVVYGFKRAKIYKNAHVRFRVRLHHLRMD